MSCASPPPVQVWIADPRCFLETQPGDLLKLLDAAERERLARFRHDADARAYLIAHAMRRAALATALDVPPGEIVFEQDPQGKPLLAKPHRGDIFFSHSRRREGVACVVTRAGAVGIDVESARGDAPDLSLLEPHMALPDPAGRVADTGSEDMDSQFRCYWTALEAYWKAQGTGLAATNPRVQCARDAAGGLEIGGVDGAPSQRARLMFLPVSKELTVAVALKLSHAALASMPRLPDFEVLHCNSSMEIYNSSML